MLLKIGSKGDVVKQVQKVIGTGADGIFGSGTVKQLKNGKQQTDYLLMES